MKKYSFLLFLLVLGCKTPKVAIEPQPAAELSSLPKQATLAVLWQQHSGEYQALCYQAYNLAALRLKEYTAAPKSGLPPAIVTDIDETILDNSPNQARDILQNQPYTQERWLEWVQQSKAGAVPGSVAFFKQADAQGIEIFYISNRSEIELGKTISNMQALGFPQLSREHFLLKTLLSDKEERRQKVAETHKIIMLLGDNLGDFEQAFYRKPTDLRNKATTDFAAQFGAKFIVLPNPMYGDWEPALFNYKRLNELQTDSARSAQLKGF